jgi:hypothetical protein
MHVMLLAQAGFNHDYGCVYKDVPEYKHLIRVLPRCFTEVMLRVANPLRPIFPTWFKGGDKVSLAWYVLLRSWQCTEATLSRLCSLWAALLDNACATEMVAALQA